MGCIADYSVTFKRTGCGELPTQSRPLQIDEEHHDEGRIEGGGDLVGGFSSVTLQDDGGFVAALSPAAT